MLPGCSFFFSAFIFSFPSLQKTRVADLEQDPLWWCVGWTHKDIWRANFSMTEILGSWQKVNMSFARDVFPPQHFCCVRRSKSKAVFWSKAAQCSIAKQPGQNPYILYASLMPGAFFTILYEGEFSAVLCRIYAVCAQCWLSTLWGSASNRRSTCYAGALLDKTGGAENKIYHLSLCWWCAALAAFANPILWKIPSAAKRLAGTRFFHKWTDGSCRALI